MTVAKTPAAVTRAMREVGQHLTTWRKMRRLTMSDLADRAGVGVSTVQRIEAGRGATLENLLRVSRALGVLDNVTAAFDPYATDVGRLRADEALPDRVRPRRSP